MKNMYIALLITLIIILGVVLYLQKNRKEEKFVNNRLPALSAQQKQARIDLVKMSDNDRGTREQRRINRIATS